LVDQWKTCRFNDDQIGFETMEAWRYHDFHLWAWECNQRKGALRRRKNVYQCFAKQMAERFGTIVIEEFNLRSMARKQAAEKDKPENEKARSNRQLASVSELRLALIQAFQRAGSVVLIPAYNTTRECYVCGIVETFDAEMELRHTCSNGHNWDQDENAARNLLTRWSQLCPEKTNAKKEALESRWEKAKRKQVERNLRLEK